jgi:putative intracellular protease/amidase
MIMRLLLFPVLFLGLLLAGTPVEAAAPRNVLLVVSGHGLDAGRARPGYEFDELSQAYLVFRDNGFDVEIASPRGGSVEADDYDAAKPYNALFLGDAMAVARLAATRPLNDVKPEDYAAIFVIGGKGAMFDLPFDPVLKALLVRHYEGGGVIGAVCHGPAAFVRLRTSDGELLVAGQPMAGFTNEEEGLFGQKWVPHFPFLLEDALRQAGARYAEAEPMTPFIQPGDRIVTGQNPNSTAIAAEAMLRAMGVTPAPRGLWPDERSLMLVARVLEGETDWAVDELAAWPAGYDMPLIAMYGFYRTQDPMADASDLAQGLAVMELAAAYFDHPQLREAMAAVRTRLGGPAS